MSNLQLHKDESIILECKPKKAYVGYWLLARVSRMAIFFLMLIFILIFNFPHAGASSALHAHGFGLAEFVVVVILFALVVGLFAGRGIVNGISYTFTDKRIIVVSNFISFNKKILPYSQVVDVDMARNFVRSVFGLSAVVMQQAGAGVVGRRSLFAGGAGRLSNMTVVDGLDHEQAEKVLDLVSKHMTEK